MSEEVNITPEGPMKMKTPGDATNKPRQTARQMRKDPIFKGNGEAQRLIDQVELMDMRIRGYETMRANTQGMLDRALRDLDKIREKTDNA